jgi:hypothetical protein
MKIDGFCRKLIFLTPTKDYLRDNELKALLLLVP